MTYKITMVNNVRFFFFDPCLSHDDNGDCSCSLRTLLSIFALSNAFEILHEIYFFSFGERYFWGNIKLEYQNSHVIIQ